MAFTVTFLSVYLILVVTKCVSSQNVSRSHEKRILMGTAAHEQQFPFIVYIRSDPTTKPEMFGHICTGTLISDLWVITSAHCYRLYTDAHLSLDEVRSIVVAGSVDVHVRSRHTQVRVAARHVLMKPDPRKQFDILFNNDIALVKLTQPFEFNAYVSSTTVALTYPYGQRSTCTLIGYGHTRAPETRYDTLDNTKLHYTFGTLDGSSDSCKRRARRNGYGHLFDWNLSHLCMDPVKYTSTPCNGDSGGPLICEGLLTGISSGRLNKIRDVVPNCGVKGNYHVYMFYGYFDEWVRKHIPNLKPGRQLTGDVTGRMHGRINSTSSSRSVNTYSVALLFVLPMPLYHVIVIQS